MNSFFTWHIVLEVDKTQILFMPFHILKTYIRNPSLFLFFNPPTYRETPMATRSACAYIRVEQLQQFGKSTWHPSFWQNKKNWPAIVWQTNLAK
jgi:hypothetical protein